MQSDQPIATGADSSPATSLSLSIYITYYFMYINYILCNIYTFLRFLYKQTVSQDLHSISTDDHVNIKNSMAAKKYEKYLRKFVLVNFMAMI